MSWPYVLRRVGEAVPALGVVLVVTFGVIHLTPGDPAGVLAGEYADRETIAALNAQWGLDKPMWQQFGIYVANLARGDLSESYVYGQPVATMIADRLGPTLLLAGTALLISTAAGVLIGTVAALRPSGRLDAGITGGSLLIYAVPSFWLAQLTILAFGLWAGWFPVLGMTDTRITYTGVDHVLDVAHHLVLPALVLAVSEVALITRLTRTGLIEQMDEGYARTAAAKSLTPRAVLLRHALPNAALPLVTVVGTRIGFLFSGAVVIETVFSWPGLGLLLIDAINAGDRPLVLGLILLVAVSVVVANLATDLIYAWIDPRVRYR